MNELMEVNSINIIIVIIVIIIIIIIISSSSSSSIVIIIIIVIFITINGVNLWNNQEMKTCRTLSKFKQIFKNNILNRYRMDEQRGGLE